MTSSSQQSSFEDQARKLVAARYSIVFVPTHEEERLERILTALSRKTFSKPVPLYRWSRTEGLVLVANSAEDGSEESEEVMLGTEEPIAALNEVINHSKPALFMFSDLHRYYDDDQVVRRLRDVHRDLRTTYKTIFLCGAVFNIPQECRKEVAILDLLLPTAEELEEIFNEVCREFPNTPVELFDKHDALLRGALGLTEIEAHNAFTKLFLGRKTLNTSAIDRLYEEKKEIVRKEGILEYIRPKVHLENIGGLGILKQWLNQRRRFFSKEAEAFGLDSPKGLLVTGISGCGKSLVVKAISAFWAMPMLRLDMNRIYAGVAGSPERSLETALKTAEAVSPCVLWIDEIETAIVGTHGKEGGGLATRIFSSFLTWMQEKTHIVFVAATANQIDKLPPELLRKGRFDEIFFVDLPSEEERIEIFRVHLDMRGKDSNAFDLVSLAKSTPKFNGAEIEQIVLAALYSAFDEDRDLEMQDLYRSLGRMVPLATTMAERIKEIKRWADTRAVKASLS